jgi:hypothetical protein
MTNINNPNQQQEIKLKKRGRKSKKELLEMKQSQTQLNFENNIINSCEEDNIEININNIDNTEELYLKKTDSSSSLIIENDITDELTTKPVGKKRGRKPKGGKIIQQLLPININKETKPSVILHLKCSMKDLHNQGDVFDSSIESFNFSSNKNELLFDVLEYNDEKNNQINEPKNNNVIINNNTELHTHIYEEEEDNKNSDSKEIWKKLKQLEHNLHINNISDKKSACFWCTHDFDSHPIYIPKYFIKDSYHVYGCFCSPECATAFLMEENIDSSTKFERYHLLNHIYSKIYNYNKNIKPAPNPYYLLNKFYGNLSIQEYRSLLKNERLFLVVDKPLTRILPELHEDNDDFIINNKIIPSNNFQIKKKLQKKTQSKTNILNEKFGIVPCNN